MSIKHDSVTIKVVSNSNVHQPGDGYQKDVCPYNARLLSSKKEQNNDSCYNMEESQEQSGK